jgi:hypothetical protein
MAESYGRQSAVGLQRLTPQRGDADWLIAES